MGGLHWLTLLAGVLIGWLGVPMVLGMMGKKS